MVEETKTDNKETSAEAPTEEQKKINALNEATEKANKATADLKAERVLQAIGGKSDAVGTPETAEKEETDKEYAKRIMTGGLNDNEKA